MNALLLAFVICQHGSALAATVSASDLLSKHLVWSVKYRTTTSTGQVDEYVKLGSYDFLANGVAGISYTLYRAKADAAPTLSAKHHNPMGAPYGTGCTSTTDDRIKKPTHQQDSAFTGAWLVDGDLLKIRIGSVTHEWKLEDTAPGLFRLNKPLYDTASGQPVINGVTYSEAEGFGYVSDVVVSATPLTRSQLLDSYKLEYFQNNETETSAWNYFNSRLSVTAMTSHADSNVWSTVSSCGVPGYPTMLCESSLLLNDSAQTSLALFVNGGHDYNMNGCYDETGHAYKLLGVMEAGKLTKMAWIEYSYESDLYPLLSVGRYYQPLPTDPAIQLTAPTGGTTLNGGTTATVAWSSTNAPAESVVDRIILRKGPHIVLAVAPLPAHLPPTGALSWPIPATLVNGSDYTLDAILYRYGRPIAAHRTSTFTIATAVESPLRASIPAYGLDVACNAAGILYPGYGTAGLSAASGASCSTGTRCQVIAGRYVTACVAAELETSYTVRAVRLTHRAVASACGDSCEAGYCGTGGTVEVFGSLKSPSQALLEDWEFLGTLPRQDALAEARVALSTPRSLRSVLVCRSGAGTSRDNLEADHVKVEVVR